MVSIGRRILVVGLAALALTSTVAVGMLAKGAHGVECAVTAPVVADPPEPAQPAGMGRDSLGLDWWYVSDDGLLWTAAAAYRETGADKVLWLKPIGSSLTITGYRLYGDAPPLAAGVPAGYGGDYQATALDFPLAGCWEVTARSGQSELRFVTYVVEKGQAPESGQR